MKRIVAPTFLSLDRPLAEVLGEVADAGVRLIELHGDAPDTHLDLTDADAVSTVGRVAAELGLVIHSVHSPFSNPSEEAWDVSQPDDGKRRDAVASHTKVIRAAAKLGASHVVIHAGARIVRGVGGLSEPDLDARSSFARASLGQLSHVARGSGIRIAVENLPPDHLVGSVKEVRSVIQGLDPALVGFCLDTGHAILGSDSPTDYVRAFHNRLLGIHWHYNDGKDDAHLFPNHEDSDWREFLASLAEIGFDLPVTVEAVPPDGLSLRDAYRAAREAFGETP